MAKYEGDPAPVFESNDKRFYWVDSTFIIDECPKCHNEIRLDTNFPDHLADYPIFNKPFKKYMYCPECGSEWEVKVTLNLSITVE